MKPLELRLPFLSQGMKNYVEPDITVICDPAKLDERGCNGAPDWVIEIVSPKSRQMDCSTKPRVYQSAGVREYWIVDPKVGQTTVYDYEVGTVKHYPFGEDMPGHVLEDFVFGTGKLLEGGRNIPETELELE